MREHIGQLRAKLLDAVCDRLEAGMDLTAAVHELQAVDRTTIYRWARKVKGHPREQWPELLLTKRLRSVVDNDRNRIWRSMRMLRVFTYGDLEAVTGTSQRNLRNYVGALHRAEYLRRQVGKDRRVAWTLLRETGPKAPKVLRDWTVWDPNLRKVLGQPREARHG